MVRKSRCVFSILFACLLALFTVTFFTACGNDNKVTKNPSWDGGSDGGSVTSRSFLLQVGGRWVAINSLALYVNTEPSSNIAYGTLDDNGQATLYPGKFTVKCSLGGEPNGCVTVDPSGVSVEQCKVTGDKDKEKDDSYIFYEPDNVPGLLCASLPVRFDYSDGDGADGDRGGKYQFLRQVDSQYEVIHSLIMNVDESTEATIAYGYLDENNEAVLYTGKFVVRDVSGEEIANSPVTVTPDNENTETCKVAVDGADPGSIDLTYVYFVPEECPGVLSDSLPIVIVGGTDSMDGDAIDGDGADGDRGNKYNLLRKVDGQYEVVNSLSLNIDGQPADIAYGYIDENGHAVLYSSKFSVRCCFDEPNGFITVDPSGVSVETCQASVHKDKDKISAYMFVEPDNCPGVLCASIPISIDYSHNNDAEQ